MKHAFLLTYAAALALLLLFVSPMVLEAGFRLTRTHHAVESFAYEVWETRQIRMAKQRSESYAPADPEANQCIHGTAFSRP